MRTASGRCWPTARPRRRTAPLEPDAPDADDAAESRRDRRTRQHFRMAQRYQNESGRTSLLELLRWPSGGRRGRRRPGHPQRRALDVSNKGDSGDWVTAFDLAAETAVRDVITAARPRDIITGEEGGTVLPASAQRLPLVHRPARRHHQLHPQHRLLRHLRGGGGPRRRLAGRRRQRPGAGPHLLRVPRRGRLARGGRPADRRCSARSPGRTGQILATGFSYDPAVRAEQAAALGGLMDGFADVRRLGLRGAGPVPRGGRHPRRLR